jgi:hypothetical protein
VCRRLIAGCLSGILMAGLSPSLIAAGPQSRVTVTRDPERKATDYVLDDGDCRIRWSVVPSLVSTRPVILNYTACRRPLAEQQPSLSSVLAEILKDGMPGSLSWGRLTPDTPQDDLSMAFRLALAAHRSPAWDSQRGRPRSGDINALAVRLANEAAIYRELKNLFEAGHLDLKLVDAEKVLVERASALPFFSRLKEGGVRATEKLPFDFQVYFAVTGR